MASSPSASEGEIVEVQMTKASTAQSDIENMHVDRPSRNSTSSASTPDRLERFDQSRHRSRSRSRSPYRRRSPHGTKRRREDDGKDRNESRRFKVHHEDGRRHKGTHKDSDRYKARSSKEDSRHISRSHRERSYQRDSRSRSRSPYRPKPTTALKEEFKISAAKSSLANGLSNGASSSNRQQDEKSRSLATRNGRPQVNNSSTTTETLPKRAHFDIPEPKEEEEKSIVEPETDEASQIEERRRKREALKAKLRSQPTPLLAQALNSTTYSAPSTPKTEINSRSGSPSLLSPQSQSAADSPDSVNIANDEEIANRRIEQGEDGEEPSAADYDPTLDMEEDRAKHDHRFQQDVPASGYDETTEQHDLLTSNHETNTMPAPRKEEFDMFADDDDDDMFASGPMKSHSTTTSKPKTLDASLLDNWDDPEGYYRIILGELLDGRYQVQTNLGKGMFSAVVRALDNTTGKLVAIKVIRSNETMKKAGLKEIDILQKLSAADPDDKKHVIRLERSFEHKGHLCMVFENLSINLREVLKKFGRDVGINLKAVRSYAQQMFLGLSLLKKCNILHADLKPDNVLVNDTRNLLKICDLGSAGDASENEITPYLVSRFYRAPEIILGMPYDFGIDIWSIGCTLFELYTGKILFTGRNNNQMLKSVMECRGKFSLKMLKKAEFAGIHFDDNLMFRSLEKDKVTNKEVVRMLNFLRPTRDLKTRLMSAAKGLGETDTKELNLFADLLDRCLALNPEKRITPTDALKHPFIHRTKL